MSDLKSYKDLDIYTISMDLFLKLHPKTLKLPKQELYEWVVSLGVLLIVWSLIVLKDMVEGNIKQTLFGF